MYSHHVPVITDLDAVHRMVEGYLQFDEFVMDVETSTYSWEDGANPITNKVLWLGFATHGRVDLIPVGHPNGEFVRTEFPLTPAGEKRVAAGKPPLPSSYSKDIKKATHIFTPPPPQLRPAEAFTALHPLLFNEEIRKIGQNFKFDVKTIAKYNRGQVIPGPYGDTMEAASVIDSQNINRRDLQTLLAKYLGYDMVKGTGKYISQSAFSAVAKYLFLDCRYTWLLWQELKQMIPALNQSAIFNLEMDILGVTADMELEGAPYNIKDATTIGAALESEADEIQGRIFGTVGRAVNLGSTREKQHLLYGPKDEGGRGLKPRKYTPGGIKKDKAGEELTILDYSTDAEALEKLAGKDPVVDMMLDHAEVSKLVSTYIIPYIGGTVTHTTAGKTKTEVRESLLIKGRVHTSFNSQGAETGRFSSSNPNMQNIPSRGPRAKQIRNLFWAGDDDSCLVVADYSQIEPRIIASFSQDPVLMKNYLEGGDVYTAVGDVLGVDRAKGKEAVLSTSYGVGPDKMAIRMGVTVAEAKKVMEDFNIRFKSIDRYRQMVVKEARSRHPMPYVTTMLGRRRYLPLLQSSDRNTRSRGERQAFNTKIQGSAADIIKVAMVRAHRMIPDEARMILTVHDEIVTISPRHLAEETAEAIREAMEGLNVLKVPLIAEVKIADTWGEGK